jgi:hypothetical protein
MMKTVRGTGIATASTNMLSATRMKDTTMMTGIMTMMTRIMTMMTGTMKMKMTTTMAAKVGRVTMTGTRGMMIGEDSSKQLPTKLHLSET